MRVGLFVLCFLVSCSLHQERASEFFAYYTRIEFDEPSNEPPEKKEPAPPAEPVLKIGACVSGFSDMFPGRIDDVAIYRRALTDQEAAALAKGDAVTEGTAARYRFDKSGADAAGGKEAQLREGAAFADDAKQGSHSLQLDGEEQWASSPLAFAAGEDFSWAAWFKTTGNGAIISYCKVEGNWRPNFLALVVREGRLVFDKGWVGEMGSDAAVNDGQWHHVLLAAHMEQDTVKLYVDGKPLVSKDGWEDAQSDDSEEDEPEDNRGKTGKYADVVVNVGNLGRLVFSREFSYRPYWMTTKSWWLLEELVPRKGDGTATMPDRINRYSYVRIIKCDAAEAVIHWRYIPDFSSVEWDGVVDEYFFVSAGGKVVRRVKEGTRKLDDWQDPSNVTIQTLRLTKDGIKPLTLKRARLKNLPAQSIQGSPVATAVVGSPAVWWRFDEGLGVHANKTVESISKKACGIEGPVSVWKAGVSGTALGFDGYYSKVSLSAEQAPSNLQAVTVEVWAALGAYPFNWAPFVHQCGWKKSGYYLGVDAYGHLGFMVSNNGVWTQVVSSAEIPLFKWAHIVGTFDPASGALALYIDGKEIGSKQLPKGRLTPSETDLVIGLNTEKLTPTSPIRDWATFPSIYGIDGLIDEVKVYNAAFSQSEVSQSFKSRALSDAQLSAPDMDARHFPVNPKGRPGERFGAEYTRLEYYETWDNMWRVGEYPDVVVSFDENPTRVAFWRGLRYGAAMVTENGKWSGDQSAETSGNWGPAKNESDANGCCEHMSDAQCRHSHVRIIENTPARAVVHWRYGEINVRYNFPHVNPETGWGAWADEYYTFYPDGVGIRHVARGVGGWQETLFFNEPGTKPEDNVELAAYTLVNLAGQTKTYTWERGYPVMDLKQPIISMVNMKSRYKPFYIYPTGSGVSTFNTEVRPEFSHFPWWNHFPVTQVISDGRSAERKDRATHSSLVWGDPSQPYLMVGLTDTPAATLIPLARSWNHPPEITDLNGCEQEGYKPEERAYRLMAKDSTLSFTLNGSENNPIVNPCFVITHWEGGQSAALKLNNAEIKQGVGFKQGIVRDTAGVKAMVIWVKHQSASTLTVQIQG